MKSIFRKFIAWTKPLVWRLADAYDLRVDRPHRASGDHPLYLEDTPDEARHHIPKSVIFNTRSGSIHVGRNTIFGYDVMLLAGTHLTFAKSIGDNKPIHHLPESGKDIRIGRNCFIGSRAILVGPVTIGDHVAVGAGAVVTKDVPSHALVAGVPARIIRMLNEAETPPR
jgi:acetyltransferase-like isoleucine patch superfamily enzyme